MELDAACFRLILSETIFVSHQFHKVLASSRPVREKSLVNMIRLAAFAIIGRNNLYFPMAERF
jgi:hypothetical protein